MGSFSSYKCRDCKVEYYKGGHNCWKCCLRPLNIKKEECRICPYLWDCLTKRGG